MHFFSRVFLPFLLLVYIAVETYLKFQNTSLCGEVGCKLAGELLKFDPIYLHYFGLVSVFVLVILGARSIKSTFFETLYFMVLYAAIAFEATILGYQFLANPEPCLFCLGVFSSLLVIALFSHFKNFIVIFAAILAVYIALNTLAIPKNKAYVTLPGNYLIQSDTCPHCIKVKTYFKDNNISYTPIQAKDVNARGFLKFVDISSIPVLVIKEPSSITILKGDKKIIAHFETKNEEEVLSPEILSAPVQNSTLGLSSDFLSAGAEDAGCALTITETPSCEDDNATLTPQH
ncbi:MAG: glutaredoxin domain-containing protein [Sulfurovum sp.]